MPQGGYELIQLILFVLVRTGNSCIEFIHDWESFPPFLIVLCIWYLHVFAILKGRDLNYRCVARMKKPRCEWCWEYCVTFMSFSTIFLGTFPWQLVNSPDPQMAFAPKCGVPTCLLLFLNLPEVRVLFEALEIGATDAWSLFLSLDHNEDYQNLGDLDFRMGWQWLFWWSSSMFIMFILDGWAWSSMCFMKLYEILKLYVL